MKEGKVSWALESFSAMAAAQQRRPLFGFGNGASWIAFRVEKILEENKSSSSFLHFTERKNRPAEGVVLFFQDLSVIFTSFLNNGVGQL